MAVFAGGATTAVGGAVVGNHPGPASSRTARGKAAMLGQESQAEPSLEEEPGLGADVMVALAGLYVAPGARLLPAPICP